MRAGSTGRARGGSVLLLAHADLFHNISVSYFGAESKGVSRSVKIEYKTPQFSDYLDTIDADKLTGPFRLAWGQDYPAMVNFLKPLYSTGFSANHTNYSNPKFDKLLKKAAAADTEQKAIELYTKAEKVVLEDMLSSRSTSASS